MKQLVAVLLGTMIASALPAWADTSNQPAVGSWTIGAGLVPARPEVVLSRRVSPTTDWLIDIEFGGTLGDESHDSRGTALAAPVRMPQGDGFTLQAGTGFRRYARPEAPFSVYGTLLVAGQLGVREFDTWSPSTGVVWKARTLGMRSIWGIGGEYFMPWSCSIAMESEVVSVNWSATHWTANVLAEPVADTWTLDGTLGLSPRIIARMRF